MKWALTTARKHWNSQGNEISQQPCELESIIFRSLAFKWDPRQDVITISGSTLRQRSQLSPTRHQFTTWELVDLCQLKHLHLRVKDHADTNTHTIHLNSHSSPTGCLISQPYSQVIFQEESWISFKSITGLKDPECLSQSFYCYEETP